MNKDEVMDEVCEWLFEELDTELDTEDLVVEKYEHACIIRWGSKKGDFPQIGSGISGKHYIITSGILDGNTVIAYDDAKKEIDFENLVWKFLCETQMEGCEKGYEQTISSPNGTFKITVEKVAV